LDRRGVTSTPSPLPAQAQNLESGHAQKARQHDGSNEQGQHADSDGEDDDVSETEFIPGQCLFCAHASATLADNMTHMAAAHGFSVPCQDCLAVDLETVVEYLHFLISDCHECICCGTQRSTVEGVQQHMAAKGHSRFDISPDTEDLYEMPQTENSAIDKMQGDVSDTVRLPSGKMVSHRKNVDTQEQRAARRATASREGNRDPPALGTQTASTPSASLEVAQRGGNEGGEIAVRSEAVLAAQLSRLRIAGDRVQQRQEDRRRGRLEQANNSILMKHFKVDSGDSRFGNHIN
jgi:pre-60S factor REI1